MIDLPFLECSERTQFSDECYGAFGRALFVAQHFESLVRSLATLLAVKEARYIGEVASLDDPEFVDWVERLWKKHLGTNISSLQQYGLRNEPTRLLHKARGARNEIAHAVTLGIEHRIEEDEGRQQILDEIGRLVRSIAEADLGVGILIQKVTNEPLPSPGLARNYSDQVVQWVCETFEPDI